MPSFVNWNHAEGMNSVSVSVPSGTQVNDVMIAHVTGGYAALDNLIVPAGWTLIYGPTASFVHILRKTYQGESGPYVFSLSSDYLSVTLKSYRGVLWTGDPVESQNMISNTTGGTLQNQLFNVAANSMLVMSSNMGQGSFTPPTITQDSSLTARYNYSSSYPFTPLPLQLALAGCDVVQTQAGNTPIYTTTFSSTSYWAYNHLMALKTAPKKKRQAHFMVVE